MKLPKPEIAEALHDWVNLSGVQLLGMDLLVLETALDLFVEKNIKWSDALVSEKMLKQSFSVRVERGPGLYFLSAYNSTTGREGKVTAVHNNTLFPVGDNRPDSRQYKSSGHDFVL